LYFFGKYAKMALPILKGGSSRGRKKENNRAKKGKGLPLELDPLDTYGSPGIYLVGIYLQNGRLQLHGPGVPVPDRYFAVL
jgi:hypothetical protein